MNQHLTEVLPFPAVCFYHFGISTLFRKPGCQGIQRLSGKVNESQEKIVGFVLLGKLILSQQLLMQLFYLVGGELQVQFVGTSFVFVPKPFLLKSGINLWKWQLVIFMQKLHICVITGVAYNCAHSVSLLSNIQTNSRAHFATVSAYVVRLNCLDFGQPILSFVCTCVVCTSLTPVQISPLRVICLRSLAEIILVLVNSFFVGAHDFFCNG